MALEITIETFAESVAAEKGLQNAAELGALLINGRRIAVVDLDVGGGPHGMSKRARVLRELTGLERAHVENAFDRPRPQIGGEFLIAEYGQPLFQAELKPVAAGNAVAGPVMKIFVRHDAFDGAVIGVARRVVA